MPDSGKSSGFDEYQIRDEGPQVVLWFLIFMKILWCPMFILVSGVCNVVQMHLGKTSKIKCIYGVRDTTDLVQFLPPGLIPRLILPQTP